MFVDLGHCWCDLWVRRSSRQRENRDPESIFGSYYDYWERALSYLIHLSYETLDTKEYTKLASKNWATIVAEHPNKQQWHNLGRSKTHTLSLVCLSRRNVEWLCRYKYLGVRYYWPCTRVTRSRKVAKGSIVSTCWFLWQPVIQDS